MTRRHRYLKLASSSWARYGAMAAAARASRGFLDYVGIGISAGLITASFALAWPFLVASVLALPLAWVLAQSLGLIGIMLGMLVLEVAMWTWCARLARQLLSPAILSKPAGAAA